MVIELPPGHRQGFGCAVRPVASAPRQGLHWQMPPSNRDRLPRGVVRDLLGITRALYRAELAAGGSPVRLQTLTDVGTMLNSALELSKVAPDTMGHRAAWAKAERAVVDLADFVAASDAPDLAAMLKASAVKLRTGS
jgi:hypothetical protein